MTFALGNLRRTPVYEELAVKCRSYSVMYSPTPDLEEGGSGVFAFYGKLCGIISATHVMANFIQANFIFSPISKTADPTIFLTIPVPIGRILHLETSEGLQALRGDFWPSGALDICFIELDPSVFNHLMHISGKQAVDLLEHKQKYFLKRDDYCSVDRNHDWCWAVDGAPREEAFHNAQGILESKFDGLYVCGGAMEGATYKTDSLTLVRQPFDREADRGKHDLGPTTDQLPSTFGGISGGGMWQLRFKGVDNMPQSIDEMFFSGICVAGKDQKHLSSRGPSALYDIFTSYLDTFTTTNDSFSKN